MKFKLSYFKQSGKWYTDSEVEITAEHFYDALRKIRYRHESNDLPGVGNAGHYVVLVTDSVGSQHLLFVPEKYKEPT